MDTEHTQTEHDVILRLEFSDAAGRDELEERVVAMLDVVERHAAHLALGPVASGEFDPPVVEFDFDVVANTQSELFVQIAELLKIIEQHSGLGGLVGATVVGRELVPVF
jgi:hypothetical protein